MTLTQKLNAKFSTTKFSFWLVYSLSRLLSFLYIWKTGRIAKLPWCNLLRDIEEALRTLKWSADEFNIGGFTFKHFWMRKAEETQWYLNHNLMPQVDCDEFALYAAEALKGCEEGGDPRILTVRWTDANGDVQGHNVAIYSYATQNWVRQYGHMGNWGHFRGFNSVAQIADSIATQAKGQLLSYAVATPELKILYNERFKTNS